MFTSAWGMSKCSLQLLTGGSGSHTRGWGRGEAEDTGRNHAGGPSGLLQVLVHMEPNPQEAGEFFIFSFFFFCNSFYFVVIAVVVPEEVGVIQNTRVLPGTQQSSMPH